MKTNETGRSMVEMLGVLAIIGVLSVAGIAGYTTAMKKNKVNNAVAQLSTYAILAKTARAGEGINAETGFNALTGTSSTYFNTINSKAKAANADGLIELAVKLESGAGFTCTDLNAVVPTGTSSVVGSAAQRAGYFVTCTSAS